MIKTLIIIAVVVVVALGGWQLFEYWERVQDTKAEEAKEAANSAVDPNTLAGLPAGWDTSLTAAEHGGATALGNWLKTYGAGVQDPRKAWIQLDYVVMITRDNPQEAKKIFADVKGRTQPNSPVWKRIQSMEKTYE